MEMVAGFSYPLQGQIADCEIVLGEDEDDDWPRAPQQRPRPRLSV